MRNRTGALMGAFLLILASVALAQHRQADSLRALLPKLKQDSSSVRVLAQLCEAYRVRDLRVAHAYGLQAVALAKQLRMPRMLALAHTALGLTQGAMRDNDSAEANLRTGLRYAEEAGDGRTAASASRGLGAIEFHRGKAEQALATSQRALRLSRAAADVHGTASDLIGIGNIQRSLGNNDESRASLLEGLALGQRISDREIIARALLNLGDLDRRLNRYEQALQQFQSGLSIYQALHDTAGIASALNLIGSIDLIHGKFERAMERFTTGLKLFENLGDRSGMAMTLTNIGHLHNIQGRFEMALTTYRRSLALNEEIGSKYLIVGSLLSIGNILYQQSRNQQALETFQRSLTLSDELSAKGFMASAHIHIGRIHMSQNRNEKALEHYRRATELFQDLDDSSAAAVGLNHIADIYIRLGRTREALDHLERSLHVFEATGNTQMIATTLRRIGMIHDAEGRPGPAISALHRGLRLRESLDERAGIAEILTDLGAIHARRGSYDSAIVLASRAYALAADIGAIPQMKDASKTLSEAYAATHDYARAFEYHRAYTRHNDSVISVENVKSINEMAAKYETERSEQKITLLEKDRLLQTLELQRREEEILRQQLESRQKQQMLDLLGKEKEIRELSLLNANVELDAERLQNRQKGNEVALLMKDRLLQNSRLERETLMRNVFVGGVIALLLLTGLLYHRYRYRKRTSEQLSSTLDQLKTTQAQLIHAEKMVTLGEMTAGLAHEIKNPLNFVTNFSAVAQDMLAELEHAPDEAARAAIVSDLRRNLGRIMNHGRRADSIIQGMMHHVRGGTGERERTDVNALVEEAVHLAYNGTRATHVSFDVSIIRNYHPSPLQASVIPQEISRVLLNILNNAMYALRTSALSPVAQSDHGARSQAHAPFPAGPVSSTIWIDTSQRAEEIEIRIRDNGPGVPETIRQKIFQPFFTTKPTGEGTGLGLSLSYDIIVNGHGGSLVCNSDDNGAEFIIILPARDR